MQLIDGTSDVMALGEPTISLEKWCKGEIEVSRNQLTT